MSLQSVFTKKNIMYMFAGAVVFGVLASQTGILGQVGNLPSKVTGAISNVSA
jgi:hypothetical protein